MNNIIKAINFAEEAHSGQYRKNGITPFIIHPLRVYSIVTDEFMADDSTSGESLKIAAILHDVVEDTSLTITDIYDNFGPFVADIVWEVTKEGRGKQGHKDYCIKLKSASEAAQTIKYADIIDNINDLDFSDKDFCEHFFNKVQDYLGVLPEWPHLNEMVNNRIKEFNAQTN